MHNRGCRRSVWSIALILGLHTILASAEAQTQYSPLDISQPETLGLAADPRFEAPDRGTVEMWLAIRSPKPSADTTPLCIVEHGTGDRLRWRLSVDPTGKGLVLSGPNAGINIPFAADAYHHLAIVTAGGRTRAIVDGVEVADPVEARPLGVLQATPEGLPLTFGCKDGPVARAAISTFRMWSLALSPEDLAAIRDSPGPITDRPDLKAGLLAYSLFTDAAKEIRFTGPPIAFTPMQGATGGEPFFYRRPPDQELGSIYLQGNGSFVLSNLAVEFDRADRDWTMLDGPKPGAFSLPTILPRLTTVEEALKAAVLERQLAAFARAGVYSLTELGEKVTAFRANRAAERRMAFGRDNSVLQGQDDYEEDGIKAFAIPLQSGVRFHRLIGSAGSDGIKGLRFDAGFGLSSDFVGFGENRQSTFSVELPPGTRLEGIAGRKQDDGTLMAVSLAYSVVPDDGLTEADRLSDGVWVERDDAHPVRDPGDDTDGKELAAFDGTYGDRAIYRLNSDYGGNLLILSVERAKGDVVEHAFQQRVGNEWEGLQSRQGEFDTDGDRLFIHDDHLRWTKSTDTDGGGIILVRPKAYPPPDDSKLPWGATFSLEHRPNGVIANFMGYNPVLMRARDYQATTGARKQVFAMPDDGSSDYTATDSRLIVPHGLFYSLDSKGSESADAQELSTAEERQKAWSIGLGGNIGIPLLASFSVDGSHQEAQKTAHQDEYSIVLNRAVITHYALVADFARIKLHPDFRARILEMRDRRATGFPRDWNAFFDDFGTHFPYAVTYGGFAWSETTKKSGSQEIENSSEDKLNVKASGILDEVLEVGVSANSERSEGSKKSTGSLREHSTYGTYGGSMSKGGGWSVGRGEELPVLLDLRHISYLLSPVFFDDPGITGELRAEMEAAVVARHEDAAARMAAGMLAWTTGVVAAPPVDDTARRTVECVERGGTWLGNRCRW